MFTGIIQAVGSIASLEQRSGDLRLGINTGKLPLDDVELGDSIAVNGICLTVTARKARTFMAHVSRATLGCTAGFSAGDRVNLEKALRLSDRLGGHLMSGHVDGVGTVTRTQAAGGNRLLAVTLPKALAKYVARKGSISVNGVSLTVNRVDGAAFEVNLIPHTLAATNLGALRAGHDVNLEVDLLARHVERLAESR